MLEQGAETSKAKARRLREGFFDRFIKGKGIDIGCAADPLTPDCDRYDDDLPGCGDATLMHNATNAKYDWVYNSHLIEHLHDPSKGVRNWIRILKPGGYLIIYAPHRDLYERKKELPSRWNEDHKFFLLPDRIEPPHTKSLAEIVQTATDKGMELIYLKRCDEGWDPVPDDVHAHGEYSIEGVWRKPCE